MLTQIDRAVRAGAAARRTCLAALLASGLALALAPARHAWAEQQVSVQSAELEVRDDPEPGLYLNAQFAFEPSPAIEEAVTHGIPVYFAIDFELVRTRWYWFDKRLASETRVYRLSYSPLTRQFRLSRQGALPQPFDTFEEAMANVRTVRGWKVADRAVAQSRDHLVSRVRLRLDTTMLPKPFQVDSLTNHDWALASAWEPVKIAADPQH